MRSHKLGKPFSSKDALLLSLGVTLFLIAGLIHQKTKKPDLKLTKQDTALNINSDLLVYLSAGNKRIIADTIWVQTLLESDLDHYVGQEKLNWMFLRFKTIALLDPLFYENYSWGGQYLAIVKDDLSGGSELMENGLKYYPEDYKLNYLLGFTYYYELGNYKQGILYLEKIMNHPRAPFFLKTVVLKMKMEKGFNIDTILALLKVQYEQTKDNNFKQKIKRDIYSLKAERDLKCLNQKQMNCEMNDAEGNTYILKSGKYHSQQSFTPYRLKRKGDNTKAPLIDTFE